MPESDPILEALRAGGDPVLAAMRTGSADLGPDSAFPGLDRLLRHVHRDASHERMNALRQIVRGNPDVLSQGPLRLMTLVPGATPAEVGTVYREFKKR